MCPPLPLRLGAPLCGGFVKVKVILLMTGCVGPAACPHLCIAPRVRQHADSRKQQDDDGDSGQAFPFKPLLCTPAGVLNCPHATWWQPGYIWQAPAMHLPLLCSGRCWCACHLLHICRCLDSCSHHKESNDLKGCASLCWAESWLLAVIHRHAETERWATSHQILEYCVF